MTVYRFAVLFVAGMVVGLAIVTALPWRAIDWLTDLIERWRAGHRRADSGVAMTSLMATEPVSCWLVTIRAGKAFGSPTPVDGAPESGVCGFKVARLFRDRPEIDAVEIWQHGIVVKTVTRGER